MTHPMQDIEIDDKGVARFRVNKIVDYLYQGHFQDLNALAMMQFSDEDRTQFAQLIGYSVSGLGGLDYVPEERLAEADAAVEDLALNKARELAKVLYAAKGSPSGTVHVTAAMMEKAAGTIIELLDRIEEDRP